MRCLPTIGLGLAAILLAAAPARSASERVVEECATKDGILGLSRVVEIDAAAGPIFGAAKKNPVDFLQPGEVVLTFDDGPARAFTTKVLQALESHCTKATFFMVGRMAAADPAMVREVAAKGHTIATHTWSHQNLQASTPNRVVSEIELGLSTIAKARQGPVAPFFRFPYLRDSRPASAYIAKRGLADFSIDIDSEDFRTRSSAEVQQRVMGRLAEKGKGIILFHDIQPSTANGIKGLLDQLHAKGYKVVHIVAKAAPTTLAEFDAQAERVLSKKALTASANPLATRSALWPVTDGDPDVATARPQPRPRPATSAASSENLPWGKPPAAPPPPKPSAGVKPWQPSMFGY